MILLFILIQWVVIDLAISKACAKSTSLLVTLLKTDCLQD